MSEQPTEASSFEHLDQLKLSYPGGAVPLKCAIQVFAGLIPGKPEDEFSRTWYWTGPDQEALAAGDEAARTKWIAIAGESREYAATLEDPRRVNWVKREWIWL